MDYQVRSICVVTVNCLVEAFKEGTQWLAFGEFEGKQVEGKGRSASQAFRDWEEIALSRADM